MFKKLPEKRGTQVTVTLKYNPPAGHLGAAVAKLFGTRPDQQSTNDLNDLRQVMETDGVTTAEGQLSGRNG